MLDMQNGLIWHPSKKQNKKQKVKQKQKQN